MVDEAGGGGPRGLGDPGMGAPGGLCGGFVRASGLRLWLGSWVPAKAPGAGGGQAEDKEWMDPHHQAGLPGQGHEDQGPRGDISSPCPSRNLRSLTFSWGHPSRTRVFCF